MFLTTFWVLLSLKISAENNFSLPTFQCKDESLLVFVISILVSQREQSYKYPSALCITQSISENYVVSGNGIQKHIHSNIKGKEICRGVGIYYT